ncbi:MAG TPA: YdeI/OmpD-associated family protein [Polyangia bacterium]|nr:YdeI/OmpD-associated family protein [Polyangia bacterium]
MPTPAGWRAWLRAHHARSPGVLLRIPKVSIEGPSKGHSALTYAAAVEAALAWGWIDGQKRALDAGAWLQRFTPRGPRSGWSKINRAKAEALIATGEMEAPGLAEIERARRDGRWDRAYDGARAATVPPDLARAFAREAKARVFFEALDGANRYAILYRVQAAKRPETRARRIETFVAMCARGETLHPPRKRRAG